MIRSEHKAAGLSLAAALLIASLTLQIGVGLGHAAALTVIVYTVTVVTLVIRYDLQPGQVFRASSKGLMAVIVLLVLLLVGIGRSVAYVAGVAG